MILPSDVLRRDGWCQGSWGLEDGRTCLDGALIRADLSFQMNWAMQNACDVATVGGRTYIFGERIVWNDTPGRTKEEVIALLEKVEYKLGLRVLDPVPWAEHMEVRVATK